MPRREERRRGEIDTKAVAASARSGGQRLVAPPEGIELWKPDKEGTFLIRILPYEVTKPGHPDNIAVGKYFYRRPYFVHFDVGGSGRAIICPRTFGQPCPICEEVRRLSSEDYEKNKKIINEIKGKEQDLYAVILPKEDPEKIFLFDWAHSKFTLLLKKKIAKADPEILGFAAADGGMVLKVTTVEANFNSKKFVTTDEVGANIEFLPGKSLANLSDEILDAVPKLDDLLECPSYDEIEALFHGGGNEDANESGEGDGDSHGKRGDSGSRRERRADDAGDGDGKPADRGHRRDDGDQGERRPAGGAGNSRRTADADEWGSDDGNDAKGGKHATAGKGGGRRDPDEGTDAPTERSPGKGSHRRVEEPSAGGEWD